MLKMQLQRLLLAGDGLGSAAELLEAEGTVGQGCDRRLPLQLLVAENQSVFRAALEQAQIASRCVQKFGIGILEVWQRQAPFQPAVGGISLQHIQFQQHQVAEGLWTLGLKLQNPLVGPPRFRWAGKPLQKTSGLVPVIGCAAWLG